MQPRDPGRFASINRRRQNSTDVRLWRQIALGHEVDINDKEKYFS